MNNRPTLTAKVKQLFHPATIISTFFYIGKSPIAPGTCGSLAGMAYILFLFFQPHIIIINGELVLSLASGIIDKNSIIPSLFGSTILSIIFGTWAGEVYSKQTNNKDPKEVVIDEVAGILLATSLIVIIYAILIAYRPAEYTQVLLATPIFAIAIFILFRIFDISKMWHIGIVEKKYKGGWGIMVDDLVAGIYTAITFYALFFIAKYLGFFDYYFTKFYS